MKRLLLVVVLGIALTSCGGDHDDDRQISVPAPTVPSPLPSPPSALPTIPRGETLGARLRRPTVLRATPGGRAIARLATRTEFGSRRVLAVVARRDGWLGVLSPAMPNGRAGWIPADGATLLRETWTIEIDLSQRRLTLLHRGRRYRTMTVAIGSAVTPTPLGRFGVTDRLRTSARTSAYGCCVLALSGRQPNIPQDWQGGDRVAIHGTDRPASIGSAVSHGCVRASASDMRLLMARVPLGTQVRIRR